MDQTEIGIYECQVMYQRVLTDDEVESALVRLIGLLCEGAARIVPPAAEMNLRAEDREAAFIECIRNRWHLLDSRGVELPGREDLVGILRTLLSSRRPAGLTRDLGSRSGSRLVGPGWCL